MRAIGTPARRATAMMFSLSLGAHKGAPNGYWRSDCNDYVRSPCQTHGSAVLELARAALQLTPPESEVAPLRHPSPPPHDLWVSISVSTGSSIGRIEKKPDSVSVAILHARAVVQVHRANGCSNGTSPDTGHAA